MASGAGEMGTARNGACVVVLEGTIYAMGGSDSSNVGLFFVEIYDLL